MLKQVSPKRRPLALLLAVAALLCYSAGVANVVTAQTPGNPPPTANAEAVEGAYSLIGISGSQCDYERTSDWCNPLGPNDNRACVQDPIGTVHFYRATKTYDAGSQACTGAFDPVIGSAAVPHKVTVTP